VRYWFGGLFVLVLALLQTSTVEQITVLGVTPNLMLVLLVCWLVVRGLDDVLPMIALAGIILGFIGLQSPGIVLLALLPLAALGVVRELHVIDSEMLLVLALALTGTVAYESVMLLGVMATGGGLNPVPAITNVILPAAVVNAAMAPAVYAFMRLGRPAKLSGRLSY
jgi:rod shape-determining protein MreD